MNVNVAQEEMDENLKEIIEKYKNNPIDFVEDYCGLKLTNFQKLMLKAIINNEVFIPITGRSAYIPFFHPALKYLIKEKHNKTS